MSIVKSVNYKLSQLFYFFMTYALIGWCMETVYVSVLKGRFVNRGFLFGPFLPIYGFGALILLLLLSPLKKNIFLLFMGAMILLSVLEYISGFIFEAYFNRVLWDYSNKPVNINGRVWIGASLAWGLLSVLIIRYVHPHIENLYALIPLNIKTVTGCFLIAYLAVDITTASAASLGLQDYLAGFRLHRYDLTLGISYLERSAVMLFAAFRSAVTDLKTGTEFLYNRLFQPGIPGIQPEHLTIYLPRYLSK